jgi:hypothetical protein
MDQADIRASVNVVEFLVVASAAELKFLYNAPRASVQEFWL